MISPYSFPGISESLEILKAMAREKYITPEQVLETVSKFTFFSTAEILSDWRKAEVVYARSICYLLMSDFCFMSNRSIAKYFDKERTVVDRALKLTRKEAEDGTQLKADISRCVEILFSVYRVK
jgi:chromosomal replication initiation ATPase DnaA